MKESQSTTGGSALLGNTKGISSHVIQVLKDMDSDPKLIRNISRCGEKSGFKIARVCNCRSKYTELKYHCDNRVCPSCAELRKRKLRKHFVKGIRRLPNERGRKELYFLTISPENYFDFEYGLEHIRKSFNKFIRNKYLAERIEGFLYVIEAKFNCKTGWNIHIHAIVYGRRLDNQIRGRCNRCKQNLLKYDFEHKEFYCASCRSRDIEHKKNSKVVDIFNNCMKEGKADTKSWSCNINIQRQNSSEHTLNYMLKYISANKDDFDTDLHTAEYIRGIHKKKLINTGGMFFNYDWGNPDPEMCEYCCSEIRYIFENFALIEMEAVVYKPPPDLQNYF
jgi:hypothetical protein